MSSKEKRSRQMIMEDCRRMRQEKALERPKPYNSFENFFEAMDVFKECLENSYNYKRR